MSSRSGQSGNPRVVLLAAPGASTRIVFHALERSIDCPIAVVLEEPVSRTTLLRRRVRRQGLTAVLGQVLFMVLVAPVLSWRGRGRIQEIVTQHDLDLSKINDAQITRIRSVNSTEAQATLMGLEPSVVVINGTRIIGNDTLRCVDAPLLNMHAGITPQYRGVHGGYWALAEARPHLVGTTVHVVDAGIDTGPILSQTTFVPTLNDSFATYPYLHVAAGLSALVAATREALEGRPLTAQPPLSEEEPSRLRFHPTLWGYLASRRTRRRATTHAAIRPISGGSTS